MRLAAVTVKNFRSIRESSLKIDDLTALVGPNGAGKSAFLKAIELFQDEKPRVEKEDYHGMNTGEEISINLTFADLTGAEQDAFPLCAPDGKLSVELAFAWDTNQGKAKPSVYVHLPQDPRFDKIRKESTDEAKKYYKTIKDEHSLPDCTTIDGVKDAIRKLEGKHTTELEWGRDKDISFKITGNTPSSLDTFIRFIVVPAVRDASDDASDAKNSAVTRLTEHLTSTLKTDPAFLKFSKDAQKNYEYVVGKFEADQLKKLSIDVTTRLGALVDGVEADLSWPDKRLTIELPATRVRLGEDGDPFDVQRIGHGSQRAFIMALLQQIAAAPAAAAQGGQRGPPPAPAFVLVIEEPEIYQHPSRQRRMARAFSQMSGKGAAAPVQILYTTHSPHFVGIDRIENIRLVQKRKAGDRGMYETTISSTSLSEVKTTLGVDALADEPAIERLRTAMTPWLNEGFFAKLVVLVEGDNDYAAIVGAARSLGIEFEDMNVAVIPCGGKYNMDKPLAVFRSIRIPTYMVWDADRVGKEGRDKTATDLAKNTNRKYLQMLGQTPEDWPSGVKPTHACFDDNLNSTVEKEIGSKLYGNLIEDAMTKFDISPRRRAEKKSAVMVAVLSEAKKQNHMSKTLESLVSTIERLAVGASGASKGMGSTAAGGGGSNATA